MILELEVSGYHPLLTKGTEYAKLDLSGIVNVFMGRNGFGKTSLMKICTLTVPDSSDFDEGGYRRLKYKHPQNGKTYELLSQYGKEPIQSFKVDGVELNDANNQTVQKSLHERHFRITNNLNKYLTGLRAADLFTYLSPQKRKDLFMGMYPNDMTYAMEVYNKIKAEHRNVQGAIKSQVKRLTEERERAGEIMMLEDGELERRIASTEQEIKDALILQGSLKDVKFESQTHIDLLRKFESLTKELAVYSLANRVKTLDEIYSELEMRLRIADRYRNQIAILEANILKISESLSGTKLVGVSVDEVKQQLDVQQQLVVHTRVELDSLEAWFKESDYLNSLTFDQLSFIGNASNGIMPYLTAVITSSNPDLKLAGFQKYLDLLEEKTIQGRGMKVRYEDLKHELDHYNQTEAIDCPKCEHKFKRGFKPEEIEQKRKQMESLLNTMKLLRAEIDKLQQAIDNDQEWFSTMKSLLGYIRNNDVDNQLMDFISHFRIGTVAQDDAVTALHFCSQYVKYSKDYQGQSTELETLRIRYKTLCDNDIATLMRLYDESEQYLGEVRYTLHREQSLIKQLNDTIAGYQDYETKLTVLSDLRIQVMNSFQSLSEKHLTQVVKKRLEQLVPQKDELMATLIRSRSYHSVLTSIQENIEYLERRELKLKLLMDNLCPNKGLIAKLMLDFIETVCGNMNAVIREIFSTPLYVLPCQKSNGDLNYAFPVINGDGKKARVDDVSECSGGESDVINFAFRYVLIQYYASTYPLFMDEVGTKLDEYHQTRFFDYIRRLSLSGKISQMFLVSHFTSHINMFDYANVIALNSEGISLPKNVNSHTVIR